MTTEIIVAAISGGVTLAVCLVNNLVIAKSTARQAAAEAAKAIDREDKAVKDGLQALLRDRMLSTYHRCKECGKVPIEVKQNYDNMYNCYHALGGNGVMTQIYTEFMSLPTE